MDRESVTDSKPFLFGMIGRGRGRGKVILPQNLTILTASASRENDLYSDADDSTLPPPHPDGERKLLSSGTSTSCSRSRGRGRGQANKLLLAQAQAVIVSKRGEDEVLYSDNLPRPSESDPDLKIETKLSNDGCRGRGRGKLLVLHSQIVSAPAAAPSNQVGDGDNRPSVSPEIRKMHCSSSATSDISRSRGRGRGRGKLVLEQTATVRLNYDGVEGPIPPPGFDRAFMSKSSDASASSDSEEKFRWEVRQGTEDILKTSSAVVSPAESESISVELPLYDCFPVNVDVPSLSCSKRLQNVFSNVNVKAKLLQVYDKDGTIIVSFQEEDVRRQYSCLLTLMREFYETPEGQALFKPISSLIVGEIVAASVRTFVEGGGKMFRRVKIIENENLEGTAIGLGVDDLSLYFLTEAYVLTERFLKYPCQACPVKLSNFEDLYHKEILGDFFEDPDYFEEVMQDVATSVLESQLNKILLLSKISASNNKSFIEVGGKEEECLMAELDLEQNFNFESHFMEGFFNHFRPTLPRMRSRNEGVITNIMDNGDIIISPRDFLFPGIDRLLNSPKARELANAVTEKDQEELMAKIMSGECNSFLAFSAKKTKLSRVRIVSFYEKRLNVLYLDTAAEKAVIYPSDLVCPLSDISPVLPSIPPQGLLFHLHGLNSPIKTCCEDLLGLPVKFKVVSYGRKDLLEVDVFSSLISTTSSVSEYLKEMSDAFCRALLS